MSWIEMILTGLFVLVVVLMVRQRVKARGGSCCSGEGLDDDTRDVNGPES